MFILKLYISGKMPKAMDIIKSFSNILDDRLNGQYTLEMIDIIKNPQSAADDQIIMTPTLVMCSPEPVKRAFGDLSDAERVLTLLGLTD